MMKFPALPILSLSLLIGFSSFSKANDVVPYTINSIANTYTGQLLTLYSDTAKSQLYTYNPYSYTSNSDYPKQNWLVEYVDDKEGYLKFKSQSNQGLCLQDKGDNKYVTAETCGSGSAISAQLFKPILVGGGAVQLMSKDSVPARCLANYSCNSTDCSLVMRSCSTTSFISAQETWSLTVPRGAGKKLDE